MIFKCTLLLFILTLFLFNISCTDSSQDLDNRAREEVTPSPVPEDTSYIDEGIKLYRQGKYEEALDYYDKMLKSYPEDSKLWVYKGVALAAIKEYVDAGVCFDKALSFNPEDAKAWHYKGLILIQMDETEGAIECFKKAVEINPLYVEEKNSLSVDIKTFPPPPTEIPVSTKPVTPTPVWSLPGDTITEIKEGTN